jgi:hypothetical protein
VQVVYDLTLGFGIISATRVKLRHKVGDGDEKRDDDHGHDRMDGVDVSHCGIEGEVGKGDRCQVEGAHVRASSRSWMGFGFFTARMVFLIAAYTAMYVWRVGKNGECVTVYKVLGDPDTSAWDVAGTVAPGVSASMFESVCLFIFVGGWVGVSPIFAFTCMCASHCLRLSISSLHPAWPQLTAHAIDRHLFPLVLQAKLSQV